MIPLALTAAAGVDRQTGRDWVERELSKSEYAENDLTPLEQLGRWLSSIIDSLLNATLRSNSPWWLLVVIIVAAALIGVIIWRIRRIGLRSAALPSAAFDPVQTLPEPGPWRASAARAAAAGDLRAAVIDQARAIFAVLGAEHIVALDSAATAAEIAAEAGRILPEHARELTRVATVFDDLVFGSADVDPDIDLAVAYERFASFDRTLSSQSEAEREAAAL